MDASTPAPSPPNEGSSPWQWPWVTVALVVVVLVVACLPGAWQAAVELHPNRGVTPWWAAWSAHLVHWGLAHAAVDVLALLLAGALAEQLVSSRWLAGALLVTMPLLSLGIATWQPELTAYRGASALALLLAVLDWALLARMHAPRRVRWGWSLVGVAGAAKLAWEVCAGWSGSPTAGLGLPPGIALAWSAHAVGAIAGLVLAGVQRVMPLFRSPHQS